MCFCQRHFLPSGREPLRERDSNPRYPGPLRRGIASKSPSDEGSVPSDLSPSQSTLAGGRLISGVVLPSSTSAETDQRFPYRSLAPERTPILLPDPSIQRLGYS